MEFAVYCLYSETYDKIYIGYTSNLIERFKSHNKLGTKGYTSKFRPWIVGYVEFHHTKKEARLREQQLKSSKGRAFLRAYINKHYSDG